MKRKSKRHFTLLEMLISMVLTMLILSTLTYFYRQVDLIGREIDRTQEQSFALRYVESRLAKTIPRITTGGNKENPSFLFTGEEIPLFRQGTQNLVFTFDHCVHLDKLFSNIVLGRLYVTPTGLICLGVWPAPKNWDLIEIPPMKKEILMGNVEKLDFEFFVPPKKGKGKISETMDPALYGTWVRTWSQEYKELPAIIRIIIKQEGMEQPIIFSFPLPNASQPITYDQML